MTHKELSKLIEDLVQRRIQLKIKLNQFISQNTFIDRVLNKNKVLLNLARDKIRDLKKADLVKMEEYLRLKSSCEPVQAVMDANLFRKQQNISQITITQREIKELDTERKRLEEMLNETSKVYHLFQGKDRKDSQDD